MRTTSRALPERDVASTSPRSTPKNRKDFPAFALIQAAFTKAASTNAMLDVFSCVPGAAGSPSTGACYQQHPTPHMTSRSTHRVISRLGMSVSRGSSGVGTP